MESRVLSLRADGLRILVVDDNDILAELLSHWLDEADHIRSLGWTGDPDEFDNLIRRQLPDVILVDADSPGTDPLGLLGWIVRSYPSARVLAISADPRKAVVDRALSLGAAGYLVKDETPESIVNSLRLAVRGDIVLSPSAQHDMGVRKPPSRHAQRRR